MFGIDIVELSAILSERITQWSPLKLKVTKVINKNTFEIGPATSPFPYGDFWGDDHEHKILSPDEKVRRYLQIHRSTGSNSHVFALLTALKQFCDTGIPLLYENDEVVDIWAIKADAFDVSDLAETRSIKLRDAQSGFTIRFPLTLEDLDVLSGISADVRRIFRLSTLDKFSAERCKKVRDPKSHENAAPHWWVAAIVEGECDGIKRRRMVHIDVCGAAHDDAGFRIHGGSLVSLQVFTTPEFCLIQAEDYSGVTEGDISDLFYMTNAVAHRDEDSQLASLQPESIRHFRCYHWEGSHKLGIANIDVFLNGRGSYFLGEHSEWSRIISEIRHRFILRVPADTKVFMCNLLARSDLNGSTGYVHSSVATHPPAVRIPVCLEGADTPLRARTTSISLTKCKGYTSFSELSARVPRDIEKSQVWKEESGADEKKPLDELSGELQIVPTKAEPSFETPTATKDVEDFMKSLATDSEVSAAFTALVGGKVTGNLYLDPGFVNGMRKLRSFSFTESLPILMLGRLHDFLEVADHPKSTEAIQILKICNVGKEKAMAPNSEAGEDGDLNPNRVSHFHRLVSSIADKIKADPQLNEIFDMMDSKGLFPNPVSQIDDLHTQLLAAYLLW